MSNNFLVPCDSSDSNKKNHKVELTFNESTNRMSHTGTAFSTANWETDTKAYMETMMELSEKRVKEIVVRATPFMKCVVRRGGVSTEFSEPGVSTLPPNPRSHLRICMFIFSVQLHH